MWMARCLTCLDQFYFVVFKFSYCATRNPCYQGQCVDTNNGYSFQCICYQGYTGATCNSGRNGLLILSYICYVNIAIFLTGHSTIN